MLTEAQEKIAWKNFNNYIRKNGYPIRGFLVVLADEFDTSCLLSDQYQNPPNNDVLLKQATFVKDHHGKWILFNRTKG